jgi:ABC-type amino acid transport substrate-binding protein
MFVHGPSNICTHPSSIPIDTFASVATGGKSNGCENGVGVGVAVGVDVDVAVAVAVGVGVAVAVGVPDGVAVGVGVCVAVVYSIVSTGGLALSRVSKRLAVVLVDSSPNTSQPKLLAGLSSYDCASVTICAELHV